MLCELRVLAGAQVPRLTVRAAGNGAKRWRWCSSFALRAAGTGGGEALVRAFEFCFAGGGYWRGRSSFALRAAGTGAGAGSALEIVCAAGGRGRSVGAGVRVLPCEPQVLALTRIPRLIVCAAGGRGRSVGAGVRVLLCEPRILAGARIPRLIVCAAGGRGRSVGAGVRVLLCELRVLARARIPRLTVRAAVRDGSGTARADRFYCGSDKRGR